MKVRWGKYPVDDVTLTVLADLAYRPMLPRTDRDQYGASVFLSIMH